jgi:hypothetical protein
MYRLLMPGKPEVCLDVFKAVLTSRPRQGQDRVAVVRVHGGFVLAVADGAGGLGGGAEAADRALRDVAAHARTGSVEEPHAWTSLLEGTDAALASAGGQCAIVLAATVRLSELPRLRSGTLPDDVAVVLCRASTR